MRTFALFALSVLLLASPLAAQHVTTSVAPQFPTYVTQLGQAHFPRLNPGGVDSVSAMEIARGGAVVLCGQTWGSLVKPNAGTSYSDFFVARFDADGKLEWITQIAASTAATIPTLNGDPAGPGGDASGQEIAFDLALARDGSIFVTGFTSSNLGETKGGVDYGDMFLAKFDRHGALQWLRQLGAESAGVMVTPWGTGLDPSGDDFGSSIVIDRSGAIYVAGQTSGDLAEPQGTTFPYPWGDAFLARFSADGRPEWVRQMGESSSPQVGFDPFANDFGQQIALHPSGSIVMLCTSATHGFEVNWENGALLSFDAQGKPLLSRSIPPWSRGLAIDVSGRVFVAGTIYPEGPLESDTDAFVMCFDSDFEPEWTTVLGGTTATSLGLLDATQPESVGGIFLDSAGDVILAGDTQSSLNEPNATVPWLYEGYGPKAYPDIFTAKLSGSDGHVLWVSQIGKTTSALNGIDATLGDGAAALALDARDMIVVTGSTKSNFGEACAGGIDVLVMRLTPDGKL